LNAERNKKIIPFLEKYSKLEVVDARTLDYALKVSDLNKILEIVEANDMLKEYEEVKNVLEEIYDESEKVKLGLGYLENYFPRRVTDPFKFMSFIKETENWSKIEAELKLLDPENEMTDTEKAQAISTMLRGFGGDKALLARPSYSKERQIIDFTPKMNAYYNDSSQTLMDYVRAMTESIEARKLFGKSEKDINQSIGMVVNDMIKSGDIDFKDEQKAKEILLARFNAKGIKHFSLYKDFTYLTLLGSPISAITQIEDIGITMYRSGLFNTAKGLLTSINKTNDIKLQDLGLVDMSEEFADATKAKQIVKKIFKITGFTFMDRLGKESFINGVYEKYKQEAKNPSERFLTILDEIFGEEANQVLADLKGNDISPNVKYLMFNELAEIQPLTLSEMPEYYVRGGDGRLFYALKSFTLKRLDYLRNTVIDEMQADPVKGMMNLSRLVFCLILMGASTDWLKDFLLGRKTKPEDMLVNNIFKMFGFGKWVVYQARREGLMSALIRQIVPPFNLADDLYKDVVNKRELPKWDAWASVPVAGKFYYWWFGRGQDTTKKKAKKKR
jgi:uncharacterized protein YfbU (UPF0304 family)